MCTGVQGSLFSQRERWSSSPGGSPSLTALISLPCCLCPAPPCAQDPRDALPYYRKIAKHYEDTGALAEAERYYIRADMAREAVEMYSRHGGERAREGGREGAAGPIWGVGWG